MKTVVQRVKLAGLTEENEYNCSIGEGLVVLVGFEKSDQPRDLVKMARKIVSLRIFSDNKGKMNWSLLDIDGEILVIPQFTLLAKLQGQNRPYFGDAEKPPKARELFNDFIKELKNSGAQKIKTGKFGAYMKVSLINDGPVTIIIENKDL